MPLPPPAPWPALSPSSPTAQGHLGARRRRPSRWSFSWLDKTTGQWKCPLCKWVSGSSDRAPSTPQPGQCSLPHTAWEDRIGLLLLERAGPWGLSKAWLQAPFLRVVLFSGFSSLQPVFMSTYLAPGTFMF